MTTSRDCPQCARLNSDLSAAIRLAKRAQTERDNLWAALFEIARQTDGVYENWKGVGSVHTIAYKALRAAETQTSCLPEQKP